MTRQVGFKPKVKVTVFRCGTCGRSYNNPATHVCRIRFNQRNAKQLQNRRRK